MPNKIRDFYKAYNKVINGAFTLILLFLAIPYIEVIIKAIYTLGTIVGTVTRFYS